ncbi:uncharacterized protein F4807DRAFT_398775 [Annulohypoxylon truncatum]|uniref:uncharacterized protein n=1 Tax=Annulohypoxylon truncatum TaxID=327061 RepID=UPI0020089489|nr:uncharacterized protein F4807DRAFT_398775 [Annulohypoxylon truncatum]KAI1211696.1 hypothetical protein F4807DRAFT_398775 [Annulohypoxylon truncatum]
MESPDDMVIQHVPASSTLKNGTTSVTASDSISIPQVFCITSRILEVECSKLQLHGTSSKTIPRWAPSSKITCGIEYQSFLQAHYGADDIEHVKICLKEVINLLNSFDIGLSFVYVEDLLPETFTLTYEENPDVYATSFFPGTRDKRTIVLHETSFLPEYRGSIFNILCHEFGRTLGMRHWNAASDEPCLPSVHFPPDSDNRLSVMGPYTHPGTLQFHQDDEKWLREFYGQDNGSYIQGYKIVDVPVAPRTSHCSLRRSEITRLHIV